MMENPDTRRGLAWLHVFMIQVKWDLLKVKGHRFPNAE
jgi:hypothetical protein